METEYLFPDYFSLKDLFQIAWVKRMVKEAVAAT
jgi:hypothetical protein